MTFNEWWAGQGLPEDSKAVALAGWYAALLYGGNVDDITALDNRLPLASGHELDTIGARWGVERSGLVEVAETDVSYRGRLLAYYHNNYVMTSHRHQCVHTWGAFEKFDGYYETHCTKCGAKPTISTGEPK